MHCEIFTIIKLINISASHMIISYCVENIYDDLSSYQISSVFLIVFDRNLRLGFYLKTRESAIEESRTVYPSKGIGLF